MDASAALLSAKDRLSLRELARRWSPELRVSWVELERALLEAGMAGEFDNLPAGTGLLVCDPSTRIPGTTRSGLIREQIKEGAAQGLSASEFFGVALDQEWFALHRNGVAVFAERRNLILPSWWRVTPKTTNSNDPESIKQKRGRAPAADWGSLGEAVKIECAGRGCIPPDPEGPKGWKTQADVEQWAADWLDFRNERAGGSTIRGHVSTILAGLRRAENQA